MYMLRDARVHNRVIITGIQNTKHNEMHRIECGCSREETKSKILYTYMYQRCTIVQRTCKMCVNVRTWCCGRVRDEQTVLYDVHIQIFRQQYSDAVTYSTGEKVEYSILIKISSDSLTVNNDRDSVILVQSFFMKIEKNNQTFSYKTKNCSESCKNVQCMWIK